MVGQGQPAVYRFGEEFPVVNFGGRTAKHYAGQSLTGHRLQPLHSCGARDRKAETFLFKFWEPYGIERFGGTSVSYRHYFNGQLNYAPDLTDRAAVFDGDGRLDGARVTAQGLVGPGTYRLTVRCPFYLTGALLRWDARCARDWDGLEVEVDQKSGGSKSVFRGGEAGRKQYCVELDGAVAHAGVGRHEYTLKIAIKGKAVLHKMHLRSWFQHNAMAGPHLVPGANVEHPKKRRSRVARDKGHLPETTPLWRGVPHPLYRESAEMGRSHKGPRAPGHEERRDVSRGIAPDREVAADARPDPAIR